MRASRWSLMLALLLCTPHAWASDPGESPTLGAPPPQLDDRTVVLFDGSSWSGFRTKSGEPSAWIVSAETVTAQQGDAVSEREFGDFQLHVEFNCPEMPGREGQAKGNSGVYLLGRYEVQVLDTFGQPPRGNGCGAIYSIAPPMVNAARPAARWQTYDIVFRAPRFDETGAVSEHPRVTVMHNGIVIHNNLELPTVTPGGIAEDVVPRGPLMLQFHGDPVEYRNIWVREMEE